MKKLLLIAGTRPEIIKQAPLLWAARTLPGWDVQLCFTGQHRDMGEQILADLALPCAFRLDLMQAGQTPTAFLGVALPALDALLARETFDWVAVQGDTTTALAGALAAFYRRTRVVHIEAGLRTYDPSQPFPEETHRQLITRVAHAHCAPTSVAADALRREGIAENAICTPGNTSIDCLLHITAELRANSTNAANPTNATTGTRPASRFSAALSVLPPALQRTLYSPDGRPTPARVVLITGHRRESFGAGFASICRALRRLAETFPDVAFVYPVHLNPAVRDVVHATLTGLANLHLIAPLAYRPFVQLMDRATLLLTDSGGVQEEAPALGKPVLVMRNVTERPEAVACGAAQLVGNDETRIFDATAALLRDPAAFRAMAVPRFPYGDGRAAQAILSWLAAQ